jgi:hypothetical protein
MDNDMESSNDVFYVPLENIFDIIPPRYLSIKSIVSITSVSMYSRLFLHTPSYFFYDRFQFSLFDKMVCFKEIAKMGKLPLWKA